MSDRLERFARFSLRAQVDRVAPAELGQGLAWRVLLMRPWMRVLIFSSATLSAACGLVSPYFQKLFVDDLVARHSTDVPLGHFLALIVGAFASLLAGQTLAALTRLLCVREGALVNRFLSRSLYDHVLHLAFADRRRQTVGELVSFYAQDVASAASLVDEFLPMLAASVVPFVAAPLAVGLYFDIPPLPLCAVTGTSLVIMMTMSVRQSKFFTNFKKLAAARLGVVNEWLQNIRVIRVLGWTDAFEAKIFRTRIRETDNRLKMVSNGSAMNAYAQAAPGLINATGIASIIILSGKQPTAGELFALLWVLSVFLARPLRSIPWNVVMLLDGLTSCRRLSQVFVQAAEASDDLSLVRPDARAAPETMIEVKGLSLVIGERTLLNNISFTIKRGEFVAIVGEVGAGKSLLLDALLREAPATFETYALNGRDALAMNPAELRAYFAFVPQDGFVMSASLRDNVALEYGTPGTGDDAVQVSLALSAFDPDVENLTAGLDTELGERGVNLSGGQRQRVGLGRAHFAGRPIVLLDDCLSAVDVETERVLLDDLIGGAWRDKTRILVTHRLSVLPRADRVLVMERGTLAES